MEKCVMTKKEEKIQEQIRKIKIMMYKVEIRESMEEIQKRKVIYEHLVI